MAYRCVHCGKVSHHPMDEQERYCAACHRWAEPQPAWARHYRLDGQTPIPCSLREWAESFEKTRQIRETITAAVRISTVFLGIDHNFGGKGGPMLFETMIFDLAGEPSEIGGGMIVHEDYGTWRWHTYAEAIAGHEKIVADMRAVENESRAAIQKARVTPSSS